MVAISRKTDIGREVERFIDNVEEVLTPDLYDGLEELAETIDNLTRDLEGIISEQSEELDALKNENNSLELQIEQLQEKIDELESEA